MKDSPLRLDACARRSQRGLSKPLVLGGAAIVLAAGIALALASRSSPAPAVYEPPPIARRAKPKTAPAPARAPGVEAPPDSTPPAASVDVPAATPRGQPPAGGAVPGTAVPSSASAPSATDAPGIPPSATPSPAMQPPDPSSATSTPDAEPIPLTTATPSGPGAAGTGSASRVTLRLVGPATAPILEGVQSLLRVRGASSAALERVRVDGAERAGAPLDGARAVIALESGAIRVAAVAPPSLDSDPIAALIPPAGLVGDALRDVRLVVADSRRTAAIASLCALLAEDGDDALALLDGVGTDVGVRVIAAYAHLLRRDFPAVHASVLGLGTDADVGTVARFLTGAALLCDGSAREALRDLVPAIQARPGYWPARLLAGAANDRLSLPEAAREQYTAVLAAAPGRPEAVVGLAPHLAADDRARAIAMVEKLLAERPALVSGWWQLAWLRRKGDTSEDKLKEIEALEHVVALRPTDADAFGALGGSRTRWAAAGGGVGAFEAASAAFKRQCELTPDDGLAWYGRAATLHQAALQRPLQGDETVMPRLVAEVASLYLKALARGLPKSDAARVQFDIGLLLIDLPTWPQGRMPEGLPRRASEAFVAALTADPAYAEASLALLAARIGERDVAEARHAIAMLPPGVDPRERAILEAALAHVQDDSNGAARLLAGAGKVAVPAGADPLTPLARELLLLGHRRLVVQLLAGEKTDATRLALRVRANAGLGDVAATRADVAALTQLDRPKALDLRRNDRDVRRTLGAP